MGYSNVKTKELKKAINNLKNFRPKCGKLVENTILDQETRSALKEFITACRQNKLMQYFEKDPYNTVVLTDYIWDNLPYGDGSLIKNIYLNHRKDIQRLIWISGAMTYLKPSACDTAADLLVNSLKNFPRDYEFNDNSEAVQKIKNLNLFREEIKWDWLDKTSHRRSYASFSSMISLKLAEGNDLDLYYSFGKLDIYYHAFYDKEMGWIFECHAQDTYDFGLDRNITPFSVLLCDGAKFSTFFDHR